MAKGKTVRVCMVGQCLARAVVTGSRATSILSFSV